MIQNRQVKQQLQAITRSKPTGYAVILFFVIRKRLMTSAARLAAYRPPSRQITRHHDQAMGTESHEIVVCPPSRPMTPQEQLKLMTQMEIMEAYEHPDLLPVELEVRIGSNLLFLMNERILSP